jgi:hypothetical protein
MVDCHDLDSITSWQANRFSEILAAAIISQGRVMDSHIR